MLGAIIGDLAGSIYEYPEFRDSLKKEINYQRRLKIFNNKNLLSKDCFFSDDTILTIAILDAIINNESYETKLKYYGLKYSYTIPTKADYFKTMLSNGFIDWLNEKTPGNRYGNGSAMRVSPIGFLFNNLDKVLIEAKNSAIPSHNSLSGIKGAQVIASAIYLALNKYNKVSIKNYIEQKFEYNLEFDLEKLQKTNTFKVTCDETVPQAIYLFLISNGFEDAIKKAISIGGDTDTIACMVGSIAEAYYGIPEYLKEQALEFIPIEFKNPLKKVYKI